MVDIDSFPFRGNGPTEDGDWGAMWGPITGTGVVKESADSCQVYADSTGMQVKAKIGRGYVQGHFYRIPTVKTIPIEAASGSPRIDTIVVRRSYTAKKISLEVLKGAPAASPVARSLTKQPTGIWEDALGYVAVSGSAVSIAAGNITDARSFIQQSDVPVGAIQMLGGNNLPSGGWLLCDGSRYNNTDYPALAAQLGGTFSQVGDPGGTFRTPNMRGRVVVGIDTGQTEFNARGKTGGEKTHVLTAAEMPKHTHGVGGLLNAQPLSSGSRARGMTSYPGGSDVVSGEAGSGGAHNNLQPYMALNFIIKT